MSSPQYPYPQQPPPPQQHYYGPPPESGSNNLKMALAVGAIVASLGFNIYLMFQIRDLNTSKRQLSAQATQVASQVKKEALSYADQQKQQLEAEQAQTKQQLSSSINDVNLKAEN